jgi:transcriptional regulator with XRE-family HTH domain
MPTSGVLWHRWPQRDDVDAGVAAFGREVLTTRRRYRMTQMQLERRSGLDQTMISRIERGQLHGIPLRRLVLLADGLDAVLGFVPRRQPERRERSEP